MITSFGLFFAGGDGGNRSFASSAASQPSHLYVPFAVAKDGLCGFDYLKKRTQTEKSVQVRLGGAGVIKDEHPSILLFSPSKAASISSSGILSMLKDFLLALIIKVKWSSYK